ncbi:preprotein translocase subunit SecA [Neorhodopirellula lusitana]|uniref:Preprotein translocase subunit SecA n=1 Tax=Neorhodopirellula lusitana TaxID=445327 RepID=A0ABY1QP32_9BACT|nr:preprotein translocase subunit SecA [Neorhodopirellula lusitana]SMP76123.1 preprotein translocase subunit SecA [Neorhodopirellula lusitana]
MNESLDRASVAKRIAKRLERDGWLGDMVDLARQRAARMMQQGSDTRQGRALPLKRQVSWVGKSAFAGRHAVTLGDALELAKPNVTDRELVEAAATVIVAIKQAKGLDLFDTQLRAGLVMSLGGLAEMQTGEGKTLSGVLPAYMAGLRGGGVHVAMPNAYLARRDHDLLQDVFALCGMTCGFVDDHDSDEKARAAYGCDITFGAAHTFGFDYLKDSLTRKRFAQSRIGSRVLTQLRGGEALLLRQRRLAAAIIDEADDVLLDDALSPLILSSGAGQEEAVDASLVRAAKELADSLTRDQHYRIDGPGKVTLTPAGREVVYRDTQDTSNPRSGSELRDGSEPQLGCELQRAWHEYVQTALRAKWHFQRDIHYVVSDGKIEIIDGATGRIFSDRTWSRGLQQAVQAREDVMITPEPSTLARITKHRYFRSYPFLAGMTGTASGCEREFARVYGLPVIAVQPRLANRRHLHSTRIFATLADKVHAVIDEAIELADQGRAVLVGTLSIEESLMIAGLFRQRDRACTLLNGIQDADEAAVIATAGRTGQITVATNLAGRGTDIHLDETVKQLGGLHVIVVQMHTLARVDRQLIGRGARCGDPGSACRYVSAEDEVLVRMAPWVVRAIQRRLAEAVQTDGSSLAGGTSAGPTLENAIATVQSKCQKEEASRRAEALQADAFERSLAAGLNSNEHPTACWAI